MGKLKIIAGDFEKGTYDLPTDLFGKEIVIRKQMSLAKIELHSLLDRVEVHSEESVKTLTGTAGWGITGALLMGPLGAIGGMLIGGRVKDICFAAYLKDGRKFLATTDGKTYQRIVAATF